MATQRLGDAGPIFGTVDETFAVIENIETTEEVEETELMDGDGDVIAVDQHTKRQRVSGEMTYKASGTPTGTNVGSGTKFDVNPTDANLEFTSVYLRSVSTARAKGEYMKVRFEGTIWPAFS